MDTLSLTRSLLDGTLLSLALGVIILGSLYWNVRLWLQDFPAEIRAKAAPLSATEKGQQKLLTILFLGTLVGILVFSAMQLRAGERAPFGVAYLHFWIVLMLFNLFDAVVIDWLVIVAMQPSFVMLPEAKGLEYLYRNPRMHIANYLKGIVFCTVFSLPFAALAAV